MKPSLGATAVATILVMVGSHIFASSSVTAQDPLVTDVVVDNPSLCPGLAMSTFPVFEDSTSVLWSSGRAYLTTQSQASYRSTSPGLSARVSCSCFNDANEETSLHVNDKVATEHI